MKFKRFFLCVLLLLSVTAGTVACHTASPDNAPGAEKNSAPPSLQATDPVSSNTPEDPLPDRDLHTTDTVSGLPSVSSEISISTAKTELPAVSTPTDSGTPTDTPVSTDTAADTSTSANSASNIGFGTGTEDATAPSDGTDAETLLQNMTLREKVGQLFIIRPGVGVTALAEPLTSTLQNYPAGGIVLFQPNVTSPEQLESLISSLQGASAIPLFMAVDEEGGRVARLANHEAFALPKYESAAAVGASGNPADALSMGTTIGEYLRKYGFNMNFAPVADVNTNPDNPIIGTRAFSPDPAVAAQMAKAMAEGLKNQSIIPVFKHFPGHGDTAEDSHNGIAVSYKTKAELEVCELLPYADLTDKDCVMVGHIALPAVTQTMTPATLCPQIVTQILRKQLGFNGLIITDSLAMGAITSGYTSGEAAVLAIEVGCDILLDPANYPEAFEAVVSAVESGRISEARINESVGRILNYKKAYGILSSD